MAIHKTVNDSFLTEHAENGDFNQYWYSPTTISQIIEGILEVGDPKVAFLSTPSLYFSLPIENREKCYIFEVKKIVTDSFIRYNIYHLFKIMFNVLQFASYLLSQLSFHHPS